jgi:hypothetical protein
LIFSASGLPSGPGARTFRNSKSCVSDKTKPVTRGFAMRLADPAGDMTFVVISAPVFSELGRLRQGGGRRGGREGALEADALGAASAHALVVPAEVLGIDVMIRSCLLALGASLFAPLAAPAQAEEADPGAIVALQLNCAQFYFKSYSNLPHRS